MSGNMHRWMSNDGFQNSAGTTPARNYTTLAEMAGKMHNLTTKDKSLDDDASSRFSDVTAVSRKDPADICKRLRSLFVQQLYTDVKFVISCGIKPKPTLLAHKAILAVGSDKFKEMFDASSDKSEIQINNIPYDAFRNVVEFLYTDDVFFDNDQTVIETLSAATKFQVQSLMSKCESYIETTELNEHNVCTKFQLASSNNLTSLKNKCTEFIKENTSTVIRSLDFRMANMSTVRSICKMDRLNLRSEMELLDGVFRWVDAQPQSKVNKREVIEPFLRHIRFLSLTCDEFNRFVQIQPHVFTAPEAANILVSLATPGRRATNLPSWCNKGSNRCFYHVPATVNESNLNQDQVLSIPLRSSNVNQFLSDLTCMLELKCRRGRYRLRGLKLSFDDPVYVSSRIDHLCIRIVVEPSNYSFDEFVKIENSKNVVINFSKILLAQNGDTVYIKVEAKGARNYKFLQFDDSRSFIENSPFECSLVSEPKNHRFFFISQVVYVPQSEKMRRHSRRSNFRN